MLKNNCLMFFYDVENIGVTLNDVWEVPSFVEGIFLKIFLPTYVLTYLWDNLPLLPGG